MKVDRLRIYYSAVIGAFGGLVGWVLISLLLRFETNQTWTLIVKDGLLGALVGSAIGFALGCVDQLAGRWYLTNLRQPLLSALIGLGAGLVGLMIGEAIFLRVGGGVWARAIGWAIFGALLGAGQGRVTGRPSKGVYCALGGLLGGLIGGATYERLSLALRSVGLGREVALTLGGAIGLMILGACIGAFMGLVEDILRRAWLRFMRGPLEGQTRSLDAKLPTTLGRQEGCDISLRGDPDVAPVHAEIRPSAAGFTIFNREGSVSLRQKNGVTVPVDQYALQHGDELQVGRTRFVFQTDKGEG